MEDVLITEFLNWLEKERGTSITTRNQRLVAIHSFFHYVQKKSPAQMEPFGKILEIPYKKAPQTVVSYLTEDEMRILLAQPSGDDWGSFRDKVLLSVLYDTGARVQELVDLKTKRKCFDPTNSALLIHNTKLCERRLQRLVLPTVILQVEAVFGRL